MLPHASRGLSLDGCKFFDLAGQVPRRKDISRADGQACGAERFGYPGVAGPEYAEFAVGREKTALRKKTWTGCCGATGLLALELCRYETDQSPEFLLG